MYLMLFSDEDGKKYACSLDANNKYHAIDVFIYVYNSNRPIIDCCYSNAESFKFLEEYYELGYLYTNDIARCMFLGEYTLETSILGLNFDSYNVYCLYEESLGAFRTDIVSILDSDYKIKDVGVYNRKYDSFMSIIKK